MKKIILHLLMVAIIAPSYGQLNVDSGTGYVQIGSTKTANDELEIEGDVSIKSDNIGDAGLLRFYGLSGSKTAEIGVYDQGLRLRSFLSLPFHLSNSAFYFRGSNDLNSQIIMSITGGNVGIGTATPSFDLHVNGSSAFTASPRIIGSNKSLDFYDGQLNGRLTSSGSNILLSKFGSTGGLYIQSSNEIHLSTTGSSGNYENRLSINKDGKIGIGEDNPIHDLHLNGDLGIAGGVYGISDVRVKADINEIRTAQEFINALRPVSYKYKRDKFENMNLPEGTKYGLIAQEVEKVIPALVTKFGIYYNDLGEIDHLKGINYTQIIPLLIAAIQEQQKEIELLKRKMNK